MIILLHPAKTGAYDDKKVLEVRGALQWTWLLFSSVLKERKLQIS